MIKLSAHLDWQSDLRATIAVYLGDNATGNPIAPNSSVDQVGQLIACLPPQLLDDMRRESGTSPGVFWKMIPSTGTWMDAIPEPVLTKIELELGLRKQLAQQSWLAKGPGWLAAFHEITAFRPVNWENNTIQVVLPKGEPQCWGLDSNDAPIGIMAATFYDPDPDVPEWLRVSWIIARRYLTVLDGHKRRAAVLFAKELVAAALVLIAGRIVDAIYCDLSTLEVVVDRWLPDCTKRSIKAEDRKRIWNSFLSPFKSSIESDVAPSLKSEKLLDWYFAQEPNAIGAD